MNRYDVYVYNDDADANPYKIVFPYDAETKEEARAKGEWIASKVFYDAAKVAISVEYAGKARR